MSEGFVVTMAPAKNSWPKKLNFCEKMFDYEEVMSQTDSESNETSCDESSVEERINVGIVESYANEPFITFKLTKGNDHGVYAEVQHDLFPVVLRAQFV